MAIVYRYLNTLQTCSSTVCDTPRYGHAPTYQISLTYLKRKNVMARTRKYYLKNNYLILRSKSHEGHYGMRHTALWSCTHIPNIIDIFGKTKKLWSGKTSLRRSRRSGSERRGSNMSPFVRRGDIIRDIEVGFHLDTYCLIATSTGEIMNKVCKTNFPANVPPMTTHNKLLLLVYSCCQ